MNWFKSLFFQSSLTLIVGTGLIIITSSLINPTSAPSVAQTIPERWESNQYKPPAGIGSPGTIGNGGTRGGNSLSTPQLIPLIPSSTNFGVTTQEYPSFLIYVPALDNSGVQYLQFSLLDKNGKELYHAKFILAVTDRIISISLPAYSGLAPLEIGEDYQWLLEAIIDPLESTKNLVAQGWIKRVETPTSLALSLQLGRESLQQQARLYAEAEIWYDAIATLAQLYREKPRDTEVITDWQNLLKAAGLDSLIQESLISQK